MASPQGPSRPPPPPPPRRAPKSTEGAEALDVRLSQQNSRRRALFNALAEATEETNMLGLKVPSMNMLRAGGGGEKRMVVGKVVPWLEQQSDAKMIGELWSVMHLEGALPRSTEVALKTIGDKFDEIDVDE